MRGKDFSNREIGRRIERSGECCEKICIKKSKLCEKKGYENEQESSPVMINVEYARCK